MPTDFSMLASDHELVKEVLSSREYDVHVMMTSLTQDELIRLNTAVQAEKNGVRIMTLIAEMMPQRRDLENYVEKLGKRLEVCRLHSEQLTKSAMQDAKWFDTVSGVEVKRFKTHLGGIVSVSTTTIKKKPRRARTTSRSPSPELTEPAARRGILASWF